MKSMILLHYVLFLLFSEIIDNENYIYIVTVFLAFSLTLFFYLTSTIKRQQMLKIHKHKNSSYFQYAFYSQFLYCTLNKDKNAKVFLSQLNFAHLLNCSDYYSSFEKKLIKANDNRKALKNKDQISEDPNKESYLNEIAENTSLQGLEEEYKESPISALSGNQNSMNFDVRKLYKLKSTQSFHKGKHKKEASSFKYRYSSQMLDTKNTIMTNYTVSQFMEDDSNNGKRLRSNVFSQSQKQLSSSDREQEIYDRITQRKHKNKKNINQIIDHFFKHHIKDGINKDYKLFFINAYFTLQVWGNQYWTHFYLINLVQSLKNEKFITKNIKLLHLKYFESVLLRKNSKEQMFQHMDLQNILESSQSLQKFEKYLLNITDNIYQFWYALLSQKESINLYGLGIKISMQLEKLKKIYQETEQKFGLKVEQKLYLYMAAFYKLVVFKSKESQDEIIKSRNQQTTNQIFKNQILQMNSSKDRGIIVANFDMKKPMEIAFINKQGQRITQIDLKTINNVKINNLMPTVIAENHHLFIQRFMNTGKYKLINQMRDLYIKQKDGYVVPVKSSLFINYLNYQHITLFIEENNTLNPFELYDDHIPEIGIIIVSEELQIQEISKSCLGVCGITKESLKAITSQIGNQINLLDIFQIPGNEIEFKKRLFYNKETAQISLKQINYFEETSDDQFFNTKGSKYHSYSEALQQENSTKLNLLNQSFQVKCEVESLLNDQVKMYVLFIRQNINYQEMATNPMLTNKQLFADQEEIKIQAENQQMTKNNILPFSESQDSLQETLEINSQSSASSGSKSDSLQSTFSKFSQQVDKQSIPTTLKIILQIFIVVFILVLVTSIIEFSLTYVNFDESRTGLKVTYLALSRLNCVRFIRTQLRCLLMISNHIQQDSNDVISDRFNFYVLSIQDVAESLRKSQIELEKMNIFDKGIKISLDYLDSNNQLYRQNASSNQALSLFITQISDLIEKVKLNGQDILETKNPYILFGNKNYPNTTSIIEQQLYFIFQNQNNNLYNDIRSFARKYNALQNEIQDKIKYSQTMTIVCILIIMVSSLFASPFTFKITKRIRTLMNLFFSLDKQEIQNNINNIQEFQKFIQQESTLVIYKQLKNIQIEESLIQYRNQKTLNKLRKQKNKKHSTQLHKQNQNINESEAEDENNNDQQNEQIKEDQKDQEGKNKHHKVYELSSNRSIIKIGFDQMLKKKLTKYIAVIFIVSLIISSYFLGFYFMITDIFRLMTVNIDILKAVFSRKTSQLNSAFGLLEPYALNKTLLINGGQEEIAYYLKRSFEEESVYQNEILKNDHIQIQSIMSLIRNLESQGFCETAFGNIASSSIFDMTSEECKKLGKGMASQGMTNYFYNAYQYYQQLAITFNQTNRTEAYIKSVIGGVQFSTLIDLNLRIMTKPWLQLQGKVYSLLIEFNDEQKRNFILLFSSFLVILFLILVTFLAKVFKELKREMIYSNKVLYLINFEEWTDQQRERVQGFLKNY